jgi:hypothetical protein
VNERLVRELTAIIVRAFLLCDCPSTLKACQAGLWVVAWFRPSPTAGCPSKPLHATFFEALPSHLAALAMPSRSCNVMRCRGHPVGDEWGRTADGEACSTTRHSSSALNPLARAPARTARPSGHFRGVFSVPSGWLCNSFCLSTGLRDARIKRGAVLHAVFDLDEASSTPS